MGKSGSGGGLQTDADFGRTATCFRLLGNPNALKLIVALGNNRYSVSELALRTDIPQPLVSRRLALLARGGLLQSQRSGKHTYYWVSTKEIHDLLKRTYHLATGS